ncbi:hypothetical protein K474DRAFT_1775866 [Panus rudis PR-1116 ss-1]|nr:hypothetical protein K474DRAFT_1775866 [Panus rudis PR-1116 ss-1]
MAETTRSRLQRGRLRLDTLLRRRRRTLSDSSSVAGEVNRPNSPTFGRFQPPNSLQAGSRVPYSPTATLRSDTLSQLSFQTDSESYDVPELHSTIRSPRLRRRSEQETRSRKRSDTSPPAVVAPGVALPTYFNEDQSPPSWYPNRDKHRHETRSKRKRQHLASYFSSATNGSISRESLEQPAGSVGIDIQTFFGANPHVPPDSDGSPTLLLPNASQQDSDNSLKSPPPYSAGQLTCIPPSATSSAFTSFDWIEHNLPDNVTYYANERMRAVTDLDLRNAEILDSMNNHLEELNTEDEAVVPRAWELWLCRPLDSLEENRFKPEHIWINHEECIASPIAPTIYLGHHGVMANITADDSDLKLQFRLRYWKFVEEHPAHRPLPAHAQLEAINVLAWSCTGGILSSPRPFGQRESQDLLNLLRSFQHDDSVGLYARTQIVAHILRQAIVWRQQNLQQLVPGNDVPNSPVGSRPVFEALSELFHSLLFCVVCKFARTIRNVQSGRPLGSFTWTHAILILGSVCFLSLFIAFPRAFGYAAPIVAFWLMFRCSPLPLNFVFHGDSNGRRRYFDETA